MIKIPINNMNTITKIMARVKGFDMYSSIPYFWDFSLYKFLGEFKLNILIHHSKVKNNEIF
jgi:hypothetical protein